MFLISLFNLNISVFFRTIFSRQISKNVNVHWSTSPSYIFNKSSKRSKMRWKTRNEHSDLNNMKDSKTVVYQYRFIHILLMSGRSFCVFILIALRNLLKIQSGDVDRNTRFLCESISAKNDSKKDQNFKLNKKEILSKTCKLVASTFCA